MDTTLQRRVLVVTILASFVSFLDGTVVTVALPAIADELGGADALTLQQWVVDGYLVTLGAFILLAGSLSDVHGRRRVLTVGLVGFAVTSVLCAVAPTGPVLVVARLLQGVAGALLVPSSLAMIVSTFSGAAQSRAIGTWTAWTGTAMIVGPLLGGAFVDLVSWRWVFWINVPVVALTLWLLRGVPEQEVTGGRRIDVLGAVLVAVGLAAAVFGLIEEQWWACGVGGALLVAFWWHERHAADPMLPLRLFAERNFAWGNLATVAVYGALAFGGFALTLFLQQVAGYTATAAGLAQLPTTIVMLLASTRFGALAGRYGPRRFMTLGPVVAGVGYLLLLTTDASADYLTQVLPAMVVFGLGLSMTVAPLTAAILGAVPPSDAGIASAVNNAVSRVAGLVVIACAGVIIGPTLDVDSFHRAMVVTAALLVAGGLVSLVGIRDERSA
ncbi:MFS transporter [Isoptericola jiangsuensis]|uniref:MFS transporter n=1 Tax=Isoptericola jiangsuensis TaxID=548579 RepID=UPI003AABAF93